MNAWDDLKKQIDDTLDRISGEPNADETQANATKVLLPIVKRMLPNIIAQDIVNVQPMTASRALTVGTTDGIEHPYWVEIPNGPGTLFNFKALDKLHMERTNWCIKTFDDDDWMASSFKFYFKHEKDRDWFIMRWS